jgi:hypothetical protein
VPKSKRLAWNERIPRRVVQRNGKEALTGMEDAHNSRQTACGAEEVNKMGGGLVVGRLKFESAAAMIEKCLKLRSSHIRGEAVEILTLRFCARVNWA